MLAAIYCRYSSDKQRAESIDDQTRTCMRIMESKGFSLHKVYADSAVSGTKSDRIQYQLLKKDAEALRFNVLIVDDQSRLGRDYIESGHLMRCLEFWGIRIITIAESYDSTDGRMGNKMKRAMKGLMDDLHIDDLSHKTHRGLEGQARAQNSCGGKSYGYTSVAIEDPIRKDKHGRPLVLYSKKVINTSEAPWVKFIFEHYSNGYSPRKIADLLNKQGVPSPRGSTWAASAIRIDQKRGLGVLCNPLYIGLYIWNRSEWTRNPMTGNRKRIQRCESEWIINEIDDLKIIDKDLWNRVQARHKTRSPKGESIHGNGMRRSHLLSGLMKCSICGGNYTIVDRYRYGCARHKDRGPSACSNTLKVAKVLAESKILEGVKTQMLSPEYLEIFKKETKRIINAEIKKNIEGNVDKEIKNIQAKIDNIISAIENGFYSESMKEKMEILEQEKVKLSLQQKKSMSDSKKISSIIPNLEQLYKNKVRALEESQETEIVRDSIEQLVGGEIQLVPHKDGYLIAELQGNYASLLLSDESKIALVAGTGFEPVTFGL